MLQKTLVIHERPLHPRRVIGAYFLKTLKVILFLSIDEHYHDMLQNYLTSQIEQLDLQYLWFQQLVTQLEQ